MSTPPSPWGAQVSKLWSAKGDKQCAPPESDDYSNWSLMQLKAEITQRQLKTNPRRRNKEAFVKVLLDDDAARPQPTVDEHCSLTPPTSKIIAGQQMVPEVVTAPSRMMATSVPVSTVYTPEVETVYRPQPKRPRIAQATIDLATNEFINSPTSEKEFLRRKLGIQAARLEIETRRLDLETKREQRNSELHVVQIALAQEQLQQAKLATQKMKTEWMVDQLLQKKRLRDAGISQEDSANLGLF
ncbi:hypothetical protein PHYBOEH_007649 [Phytophthora boehmeriae]|uniref:Uncharacterized protein n=1 Tax=Phytophthora boehmeriae TaxID=109152 RepID=A0A8T1W9V4_9STRA|nr:hypothetical protein PHYBOEH_007649 [Phytophthora boehmeriae]